MLQRKCLKVNFGTCESKATQNEPNRNEQSEWNWTWDRKSESKRARTAKKRKQQQKKSRSENWLRNEFGAPMEFKCHAFRYGFYFFLSRFVLPLAFAWLVLCVAVALFLLFLLLLVCLHEYARPINWKNLRISNHQLIYPIDCTIPHTFAIRPNECDASEWNAQIRLNANII